MIQSLFPSYPINHCIRATYKCTPQAPLDTHLRDKYLVTQSITAPRQRGGQAKTSGHQRLISHQRDNNCFSWSESYSNSKAHSLCMSGFITNTSIAGSSRSQLSQILAVCHGESRWSKLKTFNSFFLQALRSFLFWAGCPSSCPPYPSHLRDTLAVPSSLSRWSLKML